MCPPVNATHGSVACGGHRCFPTSGDLAVRYRYEISKFLISSESPNFLILDAKNRVPTVQNGSIVGTAFLPSTRKNKIVIY